MSSANVGYATLQIIPSARGFGAALNGQVDPQVTASGRRHGQRHSQAFSGAFLPGVKKIGAALAAAYAGSKAIGFLKGAVAEASDLNEAGTKLQAVFGDATGEVLKFAQGGAKALGQSNLAVQNSAALFGVYGRAAGLAGQANADFSTQLVKLSTDLASFYNTDPAEAAQAISSALRGETEPIRAYGVLLDQASVKNEALRLGLIKSTKDGLTPQAKVLATQALIMRQTALAQGDFARTSGGLANQQRILAAQVDNLKGKMGAALLPAAVAATKAMNGLLAGTGRFGPAIESAKTALSNFAARLDFSEIAKNALTVLGNVWATLQPLLVEALKAAGAAVGGLVLALKGLLTRLVPLTNFLREHKTAVQSVAVAILAGVVAYKAWTLAQKAATLATKAFTAAQRILRAVMATNPFLLAAIAIAAVAAGLIYAWKHSDRFRVIVLRIGSAVLSFAATAIRAFRGFLGVVLGVYEGIAKGAAKALGWLPGIGPKVQAAANAFSSLKGAILNSVDGAAAKVDSLSASLDQAARDRQMTIYVKVKQEQLARDAESDNPNIAKHAQANLARNAPKPKAQKAPKAPKITVPTASIASAAASAGTVGKSAAQKAKEKFAEAFADVKKIVKTELLKGFTGSREEVVQTVNRLMGALKTAAKVAHGSAKTAIQKTIKYLKAADDKIVALAKKRDTTRNLLEAAQGKLADLRKAAADFRTQVVGAVIDAGNVAKDGGEGGFAAIKKRLTDAVAQAKAFGAVIASLKAKGLNDTSLRQIIEAGPEAGLATANAILAGGATAVAEVNALQADLTKAANSVGATATSALYKAGLDAAQGLVDGLKAQEKSLTAQMKSLANSMVSEIKKALGIKSPSRVMKALGLFTVRGFSDGVDSGAARAQGALRAATAPPSPTVPKGGVQGAAASAPTARLVAPVHLDGRVVAEAVFEIGGRDYAAGRKEF